MGMSFERFKNLFPKEAEKEIEIMNAAKKVLTKKSKYGNVKTEAGGMTFDSKKEAKFYTELAELQKAGEIISIFPQPEFILQDEYYKDGKRIRPIIYRADFFIEYKDGRHEVIDVKGYRFKEVYLLKKKIFHFKFPHLTIREV